MSEGWPNEHRAARRPLIFVGLLLTGAALAVYGNALRHPFLIDDKFIILQDARVQTGDVRAILTQEYWPGLARNALYRPLVLLSFAANWALAPTPWTFRLVNLSLHVAGALALCLLARELTHTVTAGIVAALLFVVHPVHTTLLNQIVDRADLAAAAAVLWATWLYVREAGAAREGPGWPRLAIALLYAVGLLCKENAVVLPAVLLLSDLCLARRAPPGGLAGWLRRRALSYYVPLSAILVIYLIVRTAVLGTLARPADTISPLDNILAHPEYGWSPGDSATLARWGTPLAIAGKAAKLLVWPYPLSWDYSYAAIEPVRRWHDPRLWQGVAVLTVCVASMLVSWRRQRTVCFALGLTLIAYSVVSNFFVLIGSTFAERYLYLPTSGFCLLTGSLFAALQKRLRQTDDASGANHRRTATRRLLSGCAWGLAVAILVAAASRTVVRNRDFASEATLNAADVRAQPRSSRLLSCAAGDALNAGRLTEALEYAQRALEVFPGNVDAWRVAGLAHWRRGDADAALACLQQSFDRGGADHENAWVAAAQILRFRGEHARAIAALETFIARHPDAAIAHNNLAWYLLTATPPELRDPQRAVTLAARAVQLQADAGDFLDTYIRALEATGQHRAACDVLMDRLPRIRADDPQRPALQRRLAELCDR